MLAILRAFAWMRWRILVNALERTGTRDTLERLSLAVEQLGPLLAAALLIPSLLGLSALSGYAGYALATASAPPLTFEILRYLALAATGLAVVGPVLLPAMERTNAVRLLLLPIPRPLLYLTQTAGALADPWILLTLPVILCLPLGLAAGGIVSAAAVALLTGLVFVVALIGLTALSSSVVHLVVRDRRRGELVALVFVLVMPLLAVALDPNVRGRGRELPAWLVGLAAAVVGVVPSEHYIRAVGEAVDGRVAVGLSRLLALVAFAAAVHGLGFLAFGRLLTTPETAGPRRGGPVRTTWGRRLLWLSPAASAVAWAQLRLTLRTSRGRATLLSPLIAVAVFAALLLRGGSSTAFADFLGPGGLGLATFGGFICLMAVLPLAMNQFAIDGPGLTLELLAPLDEWDLLVGKATAGGLAAAAPTVVTLLASYALFRQGHPAVWLSLLPGLCATYLLTVPVAAFVSAMFPRVVDLNSIGRASNAHGLAGLIGLATFVVAGVPPLLLVLFATRWLERPMLAPLILTAWCGLALVACRLLLIPVRAFVARRRENLSFVTG